MLLLLSSDKLLLLLLQVVTLEQAVQSGADVYLTTTGVTGTVAARHLTAMKDGAVVGSIGIGTPHGEIEVGTAAIVLSCLCFHQPSGRPVLTLLLCLT
jgi:S-adenosylhomocysteine hydrolase